MEALSSENIGPVLQSLLYLGNEVRRLCQDGLAIGNLAELKLEEPLDRHQSIQRLRSLAGQLSEALSAIERSQLELLAGLAQTIELARSGKLASGTLPAGAAPAAQLDAAARRLIEADYQSCGSLVVQSLINDPRRSNWSAARVLLAEQLDSSEDPLRECLLLPGLLEERFAALGRLHVNCFERDAEGQLIVPAVGVEPGLGIVKWLDDRFIASFVQTDQPRHGSQLSLSSVDIAVLRIFGLFLARGDIFNYRGERNNDNFMAEYAGHIEQKAVVKFTGAQKKLSYGTSTEERDGASRDDAVNDYIEFVYAVFNGLPIPKKISPRKIGVILKYCIFRDVEFTAGLVMHFVVTSDQALAREILMSLARQHGLHVVELIRRSLDTDQQVAARYRNDATLAIREVLGKLADELTREADSGAQPQQGGSPVGAVETVHDYFDV